MIGDLVRSGRRGGVVVGLGVRVLGSFFLGCGELRWVRYWVRCCCEIPGGSFCYLLT